MRYWKILPCFTTECKPHKSTDFKATFLDKTQAQSNVLLPSWTLLLLFLCTFFHFHRWLNQFTLIVYINFPSPGSKNAMSDSCLIHGDLRAVCRPTSQYSRHVLHAIQWIHLLVMLVFPLRSGLFSLDEQLVSSGSLSTPSETHIKRNEIKQVVWCSTKTLGEWLAAEQSGFVWTLRITSVRSTHWVPVHHWFFFLITNTFLWVNYLHQTWFLENLNVNGLPTPAHDNSIREWKDNKSDLSKSPANISP